MKDKNIRMNDVASSFERQGDDAVVMEFTKGDWPIPSGGHFQGIQRIDAYNRLARGTLREYFIISGSSDREAYFIVVGRTTGGFSIVQKKAICGNPYRHAGGIQIIGDYLVVGVEDNIRKNKSIVYFFNIANPEESIGGPIIAIQRVGKEKRATAGAVAIAKRTADYLLIVGTWDSDTLDFYLSNGIALGECDQDGSSRCEFRYWRTWDKNEACKKGWCDDVWGSYQNLNLISDINNRLFLIGYYCSDAGEDYVDLCSLDLSKPTQEMIKKESSRRVKCKGEASFKYGGGAYIKDKDSLISYACEGYCLGKTTINEFI